MSIKDKIKDIYYCDIPYAWKKYNLNRIFSGVYHKSSRAVPPLSREEKDEIRRFWSRYGIKLKSFRSHRYYYAQTGIRDPRFIPDDIFQAVIREKLNPPPLLAAWSDKAYLSEFLPGVNTPVCILRNVSGRWLDHEGQLLDDDSAAALISGYDALVIKPSIDSGTAKGVKLVKAPFELAALRKEYKSNFVFQLPIRQHKALAEFNASSVNTMRMITVLTGTGAAVLSSFLRIGQPGDFADNGGGESRIFLGLNDDGSFSGKGADHNHNLVDSIPYDLKGRFIPSYREACDMICRAHERLPHFGFAFWDVTIEESGKPMVVEVNLKYPGTYTTQVLHGPLLGSRTEEILDYYLSSPSPYRYS